MLVLKRKEGQWVEIIHRSGDVIRLRVYDIQAGPGTPSRANLAFDDSARNFEIRRPERRVTVPKAPSPTTPTEFTAPDDAITPGTPAIDGQDAFAVAIIAEGPDAAAALGTEFA